MTKKHFIYDCNKSDEYDNEFKQEDLESALGITEQEDELRKKLLKTFKEMKEEWKNRTAKKQEALNWAINTLKEEIK